VGPRVSLDGVQKKNCIAGSRTRAVQPVAIPTELFVRVIKLYYLNSFVRRKFLSIPGQSFKAE
jgi:hypothetical protein